jgi:hypothetical protein
MTLTLLALAASVASYPLSAPLAKPSASASTAIPISKPDLRGNDITAAVATYTVDPAGVLYEEHSPQTELPRLGAPKS